MLLYRLLAGGALLAYSPVALVQSLTGRRRLGDLRGRLGRTPYPSLDGGIWVHAVSVGEVGVAASLLSALARKAPGLRLGLSVTTAAGRELAARVLPADVAIFAFPFDLAGPVRARPGRRPPRPGSSDRDRAVAALPRPRRSPGHPRGARQRPDLDALLSPVPALAAVARPGPSHRFALRHADRNRRPAGRGSRSRRVEDPDEGEREVRPRGGAAVSRRRAPRENRGGSAGPRRRVDRGGGRGRRRRSLEAAFPPAAAGGRAAAAGAFRRVSRRRIEAAGLTVARSTQTDRPENADVYLLDTIGELALALPPREPRVRRRKPRDRRGTQPDRSVGGGSAGRRRAPHRELPGDHRKGGELGILTRVADGKELARVLSSELADAGGLLARGGVARRFVAANRGAAEATADEVLALLPRAPARTGAAG